MTNDTIIPSIRCASKAEADDAMRHAKAGKPHDHRWLAYLPTWPSVLEITESEVRRSMRSPGQGIIVRFDLPQESKEEVAA